jgi:predicted enzyme related to lactoylglutathione lyase
MPKKNSSTKTKAAIPVRGVDFIMYHAQNPTKTRAWYQRMFGLPQGEEWNAFWSEFATEPVCLCLNGPNKKSDTQWDWSGGPAVGLAVPDIHQAAKECRRRKVKISKGPIETSVCWMLFIEDPEGNRIILHQRKDGTCG